MSAGAMEFWRQRRLRGTAQRPRLDTVAIATCGPGCANSGDALTLTRPSDSDRTVSQLCPETLVGPWRSARGPASKPRCPAGSKLTDSHTIQRSVERRGREPVAILADSRLFRARVPADASFAVTVS
jgi:hypothetical protein